MKNQREGREKAHFTGQESVQVRMVRDDSAPVSLPAIARGRFCLVVSVLSSALFLILLSQTTITYAGRVTLAWDPSPDSDLSGYKVYLGTASRVHISSVDAGKNTGCVFEDLDDTETYYFAATAYNSNRVESGFSNEVTYRSEAAASGSQPSVPTGSMAAAGSAGGGGGGCFVATAVYGPGSREVSVLREFRDHHLLTNGPGRAFVRLYYAFSPAIARTIDGRPHLRIPGRLILWPIVFSVGHTFAAFLILCTFIAVVFSAKARKKRVSLRTSSLCGRNRFHFSRCAGVAPRNVSQ
jgi:hypothetical protein